LEYSSAYDGGILDSLSLVIPQTILGFPQAYRFCSRGLVAHPPNSHQMALMVISIDVTLGYGDFTCRINGKDFIEAFHYFLYFSLSDPMAGRQSEMGVYIEKHSDIMEWNKEEKS